MPSLPDAMGGGPSTTLTRGLLWAVAAVNGPPKGTLRLVIQSQDAAAANSFATWLVNRSKALSRNRSVRKAVPDVDKTLSLFAPTVTADRLTLDSSAPTTVHFFRAVVPLVMQPLRRNRCTENLRQIGLALHNYHDPHKSFPAQANFDSTGQPLLSWRVHLLPYLGEEKLYKEFHLDEPWDSEHNKKLIARMPAVYRCPSMQPSLRNKTTYLAPVHESAMFTGAPQGVPIRDVKDGTANTIFIVDADDAHAVIWTKPEDLQYDPTNPRRGLVGHHDGWIVTLFVDGSMRFLPETIADRLLHALFTRKGGESHVVPE